MHKFLQIETGKITDFPSNNSEDGQSTQESNKLPKDGQPPLLNSKNDNLEEELNEAINDIEHRVTDLKDNQLDKTNEQELLDLTGGLLELELKEATKDDAYVPSSLDNSLFEKVDNENFEYLTVSMSALPDINQEMKYFSLDKVAVGNIPVGIIVQDYSLSDKMKLTHLYQSNKVEDTKELFHYISQHIHNRLMNCASSFRKWIVNPSSGEPIFYRNCIPCTNAVDLNLQSLFDQQININKLKHYFVNTCNMEKQWISYISNMEYLHVDLKRHPTTTFTDLIRQNLILNHRYVLQGIVKSDRGINHKDFLHVCNLINDEYGHIWIIDGQIERVFDFNQSDDIKELDNRYRIDYVARASTGLFRPPSLIQYSKHFRSEFGSEEAPTGSYNL
ncbi:unnamed protein product [Rotaria sp. Silwood2]|nr:unnamed protein product [Rotaria sp. Silwood2]CAF2888909.1 unnamed protein product [Rotaria sp. Silwood2]CAF3307283.1 unnamed protein product [Rotaria sp. Silwood2]CAF4348289.1 unnamed protein product [Rotaria sp. Silwood2]